MWVAQYPPPHKNRPIWAEKLITVFAEFTRNIAKGQKQWVSRKYCVWIYIIQGNEELRDFIGHLVSLKWCKGRGYNGLEMQLGCRCIQTIVGREIIRWSLGRRRRKRRREINIKIDPREMDCETGRLMELIHCRHQWLALVWALSFTVREWLPARHVHHRSNQTPTVHKYCNTNY
jgi:hypothetical protein